MAELSMAAKLLACRLCHSATLCDRCCARCDDKCNGCQTCYYTLPEKELVRRAHVNNKPEETVMNNEVQDTLEWLIRLPESDVSFKEYLAAANEATIRAALAGIEGLDGVKTKEKAFNRQLKKVLEASAEQIKGTETRQTRAVALDLTTLQADRDQQQVVQELQADREKLIAQAHEVIGRVQSNLLMNKFTTVSNLIHLKQIKESKIYRDLPMVGTWDKYCDYIGLSRQKVDEDLANLAAFGEDFLLTSQQFGLGYREMRKLRQLTHDGSVVIKGECLCLPEEAPIPIDQDHTEELQAAIERIITAGNEIKERNKKLEKDFKGALKEETMAYASKEKALLKEVERLKAFDPEEKDREWSVEQMVEIEKATNEYTALVGAFIVDPRVEEDRNLQARVSGHLQEAEMMLQDLRLQLNRIINLYND